MAIYNKLTESKFKAVKILLAGGASVAECAEYMQLGESVVYRIRMTESWEEYNQQTAARMIAEKKRKAEKAAKQAAAKEVADKVGAVPAKELVMPEEKTAEVIKEIRQTVTVQATHYMEEQQRKTNELLTLISAKLAFIVDELCGVKK